MRRRNKWIMATGAVTVATAALGWTGYRNAMSIPAQRVATLGLSALPGDTRPIRIALLSDVHVGNLAMRTERLAAIVAAVNRAVPHIVLLAGDFVVGEARTGTAERARDLAPLAGLRAPGGVFAVLGNHDHWTGPDAIRGQLARASVRVLDNAAVRRGAITIVGIGDRFSGYDDIPLAAARATALGGVPIAFTHSPDLSPDLPTGMALLLAGHTHCGQLVAPVVGPVVRYSRGRRLYDPKYRCGRIEDSGRTTIVTAGIAPGTVPLRFNAPPDWWLIELKPRTPRATGRAAPIAAAAAR